MKYHVVLAVLMFVASLGSATAAAITSTDDPTFYFSGTNPRDADWQGFSKGFFLPMGGKLTGLAVDRWDPVQKRWIDETNEWTFGTTPQNGAPSNFELNVENSAAPAVPKGTSLRFCVKLNTSDLGLSQATDLKFPPDKQPGALKSKEQAPGRKGNGLAVGRVDADLDNTVFAGGDAGLSLPSLGLNVPPHDFAYLFQLNNLTGDTPLTELRLTKVGHLFSEFLVLGNTHDDSAFPIFMTSDPNAPPGSGTLDAAVALFNGLGAPGVAPLSWSVVGQDAVAMFAGLLPGQSSDILVGLSSESPGIGMSMVTDGNTGVENFVLLPVPEPSSLVLLCGGIVGIGIKRLLRHEALRRIPHT